MTNRAVHTPGRSNRFHIRHLNIGRRERGSCDCLTTSINSDETAEWTKNNAPVIPASKQLMVVLHIVFVDKTTVEVAPGKPDPSAEKTFDVTFKGHEGRSTPKDTLRGHDFNCEEVEICYSLKAIHSSKTTLREALDDAVW